MAWLRGPLTVGTCALLLAAPLAAGPASADPDAGNGTDAVSALGGCLVGGSPGDILFLMDQSASLQESDPDSQRVDSATYLAESLASFAERNQIDLNLAASGFDVDYRQLSSWESISDGEASRTANALNGLEGNATGWETDYWTALEGARQELRDRQAAEGGDRCQAVVWFSDGKFELDTRSTSEEVREYGVTKPYSGDLEITSDQAARDAEAQGRASLCRAGGLADQLRASGVRLLAVGLQGLSKAQDFGFMNSVATGADYASEPCGEIQGSDKGEFTLATDINDLILAFDRLSDPDQAPIESQKPACQSSSCVEGLHSVVLDSSIRGARILAASDLPTATIEVKAPGESKPVVLSPQEDGTARNGAASMAWRWVSPTAAEITLTPEDPTEPAWSGVWTLAFVDPQAPPGATTRTNIHVEGDLTPAVAEAADEWRVGDTIEGLEFGLRRTGTEEVVDPATVVSTVSLSSTIELPNGEKRGLLQDASASQLGQPVAVNLTNVDPGPAVLDLRLSVTTAPALGPDGATVPGTSLAPQTVRIPVELLPPLDYPSTVNQIDFGTTEGVGPLDAALPVTGPGCVWVSDTQVLTSPEDVGRVTIAGTEATSPDACLRIEGAKEAPLPLSLSVQRAGNGAITGTLTVHLAPPDETTRAIAQEVRFIADLRKPVDEVLRNSLAIVLLVGGIILPILFLWLIAWWQARIPAGPLMVAAVDVEMRGGSLIRRGRPAPLSVAAQEFSIVTVGHPGQRRVQLPVRGIELRARSRNPLRPAVSIEAPGSVVRTTSTGGRSLDLAVSGSYALLEDQSGDYVLLLVVSGLASDQQRATVLATAQDRAADWLERHAPEPAQVRQPDDPWTADGRSGMTRPASGSNPSDDDW